MPPISHASPEFRAIKLNSNPYREQRNSLPISFTVISCFSALELIPGLLVQEKVVSCEWVWLRGQIHETA